MLLDNRRGRRKRYVAPERSRDAPPINYDGRHPFDFTVGKRKRSRRWLEEGPDRGDLLSYEPIRIQYDTKNLESLLQDSLTRNSVAVATQAFLLLYEVIPRVTAIWRSALRVIPVQGPLFPLGNLIQPNDDLCPPASTSGIPVDDADLWIHLTTNKYSFCDNSKGEGFNTLALALSCERDQYDRPVTGSMDFCLENIGSVSPIEDIASEIVIANNRTSSSPPELTRANPNYDVISKMVSVAAHEVGHILGLTSDSLPFIRHALSGEPYTPRPFRLSSAKCSNGDEQVILGAPSLTILSEDYEVTTPVVRQVVRNQFRCQRIAGAALENQPTSVDCFGSHWEERLYYSELMGAFISPTANTLTPLTLAYLEDTSWYRANYASPYVSNGAFGHLLGCDFVEKPCIADGIIPPYGQDNFCSETMELASNGIVTRQAFPQKCDPTHQFKAHCDFRPVIDSDTNVPEYVYNQYFPNGGNVGIPHSFVAADYCPIASQELSNCQDPDAALSTSPEYPRARELYGPESKCFEVVTRDRSICLESICNEKIGKLQMKVLYGLVVTCEHDGQIHTLLGNTRTDPFQIKCPRLAQACPNLVCPSNCSGRGICQYNEDDETTRCECFDKRDITPGCYETSMAAAYRQADFLNGNTLLLEKKADTEVFLIVIGLLFGTLLALQSLVHIRQAMRRRKDMQPVKQVEEEEEIEFRDEPNFPDLLPPGDPNNLPPEPTVQVHMNGSAVNTTKSEFPDLLAPPIETSHMNGQTASHPAPPPRYGEF